MYQYSDNDISAYLIGSICAQLDDEIHDTVSKMYVQQITITCTCILME